MARPLTVATLNCLNLALPGRPIYEGFAPWTGEEYAARSAWLGALLARLRADLVLVQEVFDAEALAEAVARSGDDYASAAPAAGGASRRPSLGIAWRRGWEPRLETIEDFDAADAVPVPEQPVYRSFSRPVLRAELDCCGLVLLNVHLKSRRGAYAAGEDPGDGIAQARAELRSLIRRGAEAAALRRLVERELAAGAALVVAGDFNDAPDAVTTRIIGASACRDDERERDARPDLLVDAYEAAGLASHDAPATTRGAPARRIDQVLVSRRLLAGEPATVGRVVGVETHADHLAGDPPRWVPDHAAVVVRFALDG